MVKFGFILVVLFLSSSCSSIKKNIISDYKKLVVKQFGTNMCWAAAEEGLSIYRGDRVSQIEIVKRNWELFTRTSLDDDRLIEIKDTPAVAMRPEGIRIMMSVGDELRGKEIDREIDQNYPVVVMANSHIQIIIGYDKNSYYLANPWFGKIVKTRKSEFKYLRPRFNNERAKFFSLLERKDAKYLEVVD